MYLQLLLYDQTLDI